MTFRFLDTLRPEHRALLEGAAHRLVLTRGEYLLRRGEAGGDVYLLLDGSLEVLDSRRAPEVILAVLDAGTLVGEMAFIDGSPRSVDVRAGADSAVLRWARDDLQGLIERQPDFGAAFFLGVSRLANERLRRLTEGAMAGAFEKEQQDVNQAGVARAREEARALAELVKSQLLEADTRLRAAGELDDRRRVWTVLDGLERIVGRMFGDHHDPEAHAAAAEVLDKELHPYLTRSAFAAMCDRHSHGEGGNLTDILAHVHRSRPDGEGALGEAIDAWLLQRPTLAGLRTGLEHTARLCLSALPPATGGDAGAEAGARVMLVNAGSGELLRRLADGLEGQLAVLTVVDQSHDALGAVDRHGAGGPGGVRVVAALENLTRLSMGRLLNQYDPQQVIVVDGLLEYLPDRLALSLLAQLRELLAAGGSLVLTALAPSPDQFLLDRLLGLPTIRRPAEALEALVRAAGFVVTESPAVPEPALLLAARGPAGGTPSAPFAPGVHQK